MNKGVPMFMRIVCVSLLFSSLSFASEPAAVAAASSSSSSVAAHAPCLLSSDEEASLTRADKDPVDGWKRQKKFLKKKIKEYKTKYGATWDNFVSWNGKHVLEHASKHGDTEFMRSLFAHGQDKKMPDYVPLRCLMAARKPYVAHYVIKHVVGAQVLEQQGKYVIDDAIERYVNVACAPGWQNAPTEELPDRARMVEYYLRLGIEPTEAVAQKVEEKNQHAQQYAQRGSDTKWSLQSLAFILRGRASDLRCGNMIKQLRKEAKEQKLLLAQQEELGLESIEQNNTAK